MPKPKLLLTLILTLVSMGGIGCVEVRDKNEEPASPTDSAKQPPQQQNLATASRFQIEALAEANSYRLKINLPEGVRGLQKRLLSPPANGSNWSSKELDSSLRFFTDEEVSAGQKYAYRFGKILNGEWVYSQEEVLQIPVDLVFAPTLIPNDESQPLILEGYERVFLPPHSTLTTNGKSITVKGRILIAEDTTLQTFSKGQTADGKHGQARHGGKILLQFEKAVGHLRLELRGEHGAQGLAGEAYPIPAPPGVGSDANILGDPCHSFPGNTGSAGLKGHIGSNGGNGGDSGAAVLNIADTTEFSLDSTIEAGAGGSMGLGGPGQPGGPSGTDCNGRPNGSKGPDGPSGDNGLPGRAGGTQTLCLNSKTQNSICY